jgi:hypothetical protein
MGDARTNLGLDPLPSLAEIEKRDKKTKEIPAHLPTININRIPRKKSIFVLVLLTIFTLGVYPALWYSRKAEEFENLGTQKKINPVLPLILLILNIMTLALVLIFPLTITTDMGQFYQYLTSFQYFLIYGFAGVVLVRICLSLFLAFSSRAIINEALKNKGSGKKISGFLTFIFCFYYLQYEVNRIIDDKEETVRKAPWIIVILVVLAVMLALIFSIFGFL